MKKHTEDQQRELKSVRASLMQALLTMQSTEEMEQLLNDLCTPAELEAMIDRWWVLLLLRQNKPYREISERTGVSVTTVGRVARFFAQGAGGYKLAIQRSA